MVDIKDTSVLTTGLSEKNDTVADVVHGNFIDDDMDNLAYSDSESASIAMADDEFCDALDHLMPMDTNPPRKENGKHFNCSKILIIWYQFFFYFIFSFRSG